MKTYPHCHQRLAFRPKTCGACGKTIFDTKRKRFCNAKCRGKARREQLGIGAADIRQGSQPAF